jgi:hypothetical protein
MFDVHLLVTAYVKLCYQSSFSIKLAVIQACGGAEIGLSFPHPDFRILLYALCRYPISCIKILKIYRLLCFSLYKKTASCYDPPDRHLKYSAEIIDRRRTRRRRHRNQWTEQPGMTPFAGIQQLMKLHESKHRTAVPPINWVLHSKIKLH